jgi:hypothetical protein
VVAIQKIWVMGRMGRGRPGLADGTMWNQESFLKVLAITIAVKFRLGSESVGAVVSENDGGRHEGWLPIAEAMTSGN